MAESFIIHLPNLLDISKKFTFTINPHFEEILKDSKDWIRKYSGDYEAQFFREDLERLCAYAYPYADAELLKLVVDYNNYLFLTDELADENEEIAKKFGKTVLSIVEDLETETDCLIGLATKDILHRIRVNCRPYEYEMICNNLRHYIKITAEETKRRQDRTVLDLATYKKHRPILAGCEIWYTLAVITNKIKMPQDIYQNEDFMNVHDAASEMLWIGNDVYSFAKEYRRNVYDTNIVTILMKEYNISMQEAFDEVGKIYQELQDTFDKSKQRLIETINHPEVNHFIDVLETFIMGNLEWSATTVRYKEKGEDFKATHMVKLYKRHDHY